PPYVKRDLAKRCSQCTPEPMVVDEPPIEEIAMLEEGEKEEEPEPECKPEIDLMELKRRRVQGMYQNTEDEEEQVAMLEACTQMREVPCFRAMFPPTIPPTSSGAKGEGDPPTFSPLYTYASPPARSHQRWKGSSVGQRMCGSWLSTEH
ncbi:hypothetical protein DFH08DRAFT_828291, partial [Mycena albidolilacea]